jgi:Flp pilus assembly protein TadD
VPAPGGFRVTTPILSDLVQPATADTGLRITPVARRAFPRSARLYCSFDILNAGRDAEGRTRVRAGHALQRADAPAGSAPALMDVAPGPDGTLNRTLAMFLKTVSPGPHQLVLTVKDDVTGQTLEVVEPFDVTDAVGETASAEPPPARPPAAAPAPAGFVEPRATLERAERLGRGEGDVARQWGVAAALMLGALGRNDEAIGRLQQLAKKAPNDPDVLLALAAIEESRIDAEVGRSAEVPPAGSESMPQFQRVAARDRLLKEVEGRYRAVLAARPDEREARLRLGRVLQQRGDREALANLEQVAKGEGEPKALALLFLGQWFDGAEAPKEALASYRQAFAAAPHSQAACMALAQAQLRGGDAAGARETIEKGLSVGGLDPFLTYQRPALRLGTTLVTRLEKEGAR